jgi:hypothetical protein
VLVFVDFLLDHSVRAGIGRRQSEKLRCQCRSA